MNEEKMETLLKFDEYKLTNIPLEKTKLDNIRRDPNGAQILGHSHYN